MIDELELASQVAWLGNLRSCMQYGAAKNRGRMSGFLEVKVHLFSENLKVKVKSLSHVRLFATLWTVPCQAPLSMGFSRQEYWSGLPFPSPGDLPDPGIEPSSPTLKADALTYLGLPHWRQTL